MSHEKWNMTRLVMLSAGIFSISGVIFGLFFHPYFLFIPVFVGSMQMIFALTGFCAMAALLSKGGAKHEGRAMNPNICPMKLSLNNLTKEVNKEISNSKEKNILDNTIKQVLSHIIPQKILK
jgi:hypothetical protein